MIKHNLRNLLIYSYESLDYGFYSYGETFGFYFYINGDGLGCYLYGTSGDSGDGNGYGIYGCGIFYGIYGNGPNYIKPSNQGIALYE